MRHPTPLLIAAAILAGPAAAQDAADAVAPEAEAQTGAPEAFAGLSEAARAALEAKAAGEPVEAAEFMVAAANPLAVEAGVKVLRDGGTAADAMVAVQAMLGLVEPQSSGLGGGAFLVWHDGASGEMTTLDGRETAPRAATPTLFQDEAGEPLEFFDAVVGGLSVGTPGTPMLMAAAHERWGNREWPALLQDAIDLAEEGFAVSPRLAELVAEEPPERLPSQEAAAAYFVPGGKPIAAGDTLTNPDYAETLRAIADGGAEAFYEGEIAEAIVEAVQGASNPGAPLGRGSRRLRGGRAAGGLRPLPGRGGLRHGSAVVRRAHGGSDPGDARALRHRRHGPRIAGGLAADRRRLAARLRRPRPLHGRQRLRARPDRGAGGPRTTSPPAPSFSRATTRCRRSRPGSPSGTMRCSRARTPRSSCRRPRTSPSSIRWATRCR